MDISGQYEIALPREAVWQSLMDPEVLRRCVPGCESLELVAPNRYKARIALAIGPVRASFDTALELENLVPPESYRIRGGGRGGAVGFGEGHADVSLAAADSGGTVLHYEAAFSVGGRLAQLGSRLVLGTTRKLADEFFAKLADEIGSGGSRAEIASGGALAPPPGRSWRRTVLIILVVLAAALLVWQLSGATERVG
jgi:carbon monoxide dehydrogenase subunit G